MSRSIFVLISLLSLTSLAAEFTELYQPSGSIINHFTKMLANEFEVVDPKAIKRDYQQVVSDINCLRQKQRDLKRRLGSSSTVFNQVIHYDELLVQAYHQQRSNIISFWLGP